VLRYIEIALFVAFIIVLLGGVLNTSTETGSPMMFILAVAASFVVGWTLPKFVQYIKTRLK
jgi:hypothetical protein